MAIPKPLGKIILIAPVFFIGFFASPHLFDAPCALAKENKEKDTHHLVILGDPHLPGRNISEKENVIKTINSWDDVDMVVALGDISFELGTADELIYAKKFFSQLQKPFWVIAGNHDYIYDDFFDNQGRKKRASPETQRQKLQGFAKAFNLPNLYYSKRLGGYVLFFLSTDELGSSDLARISEGQMNWLRSELDRNKGLPTIIFFHAPLKGTLKNYNKNANTTNFVAQPEEKFRELILQNPQIFLWVSGHMHTPATNESYASDINLYEKQVTNIHNCDMNRGTIWTNSIFLHPDKVIIKTFNHKKGVWMEVFERTIIPRKKIVEPGRASPR